MRLTLAGEDSLTVEEPIANQIIEALVNWDQVLFPIHSQIWTPTFFTFHTKLSIADSTRLARCYYIYEHQQTVNIRNINFISEPWEAEFLLNFDELRGYVKAYEKEAHRAWNERINRHLGKNL